MSAKHKDTSRRELLWSPMRWEADAASGSRGTRMWQNFTSEQTQKANFDFVPGFVCSAMLRREGLGLHARLALRRKSLPPAVLCSFTSDPTCQLFDFSGNRLSPSLGPGWYFPGVRQQAAVTQFSLLPARVKCHVLSGWLWSHLRAERCAECNVCCSRLLVLAWGMWPLLGPLCRAWWAAEAPVTYFHSGSPMILCFLAPPPTPVSQWCHSFFGNSSISIYIIEIIVFSLWGNRVKWRVRGSTPVVVKTWEVLK